MAYTDQQMSGNRMIAIVLVVLIHLAVGYLLVTGLAVSAFKEVVKTVTTVDIDDEVPEPEEEPPPPEEPQPETSPPPIVAPPPPVSIATRPPPIRTQTQIPPPAPIQIRVPPPAPIAVRVPPPAPVPVPTPPPPSKARGVQPDNQARWQRQIIENYPTSAIRREEEGVVGVSVTVNGEGRVAGCNVTSSSGSSALDSAACSSMTRYARFKPALNAAGNGISSTWSTRILYQLD